MAKTAATGQKKKYRDTVNGLATPEAHRYAWPGKTANNAAPTNDALTPMRV